MRFMFSKESSGYSVGSFDITATEPTPCAESSLQSRTMRSMTALTYGQWLQMNMTTSPFGPLTAPRPRRLPSTHNRAECGEDAALRAGGACVLPEDAVHHAVHVLRVRAGDAITLFNGRGGEYTARVAAI